MNERIKELWWKARIGYNEQNCDPEVLEKFAELIVRECMQIANTYQKHLTEALEQPEQETVARSDAYDMIDRFLQNNLNSDADYAEYSKALDSIYTTPPQRKPLTAMELDRNTNITAEAITKHFGVEE